MLEKSPNQQALNSTLFLDDSFTSPVLVSFALGNIQISSPTVKKSFKVNSTVKYRPVSQLSNPQNLDQKNEKKSVIPIGVCFDMGDSPNEKICLYTQDSQLLAVWMGVLRRWATQMDFHQLYKAIKRIGKGNCATVYLGERRSDGYLVAVKSFSKENISAEKQGRRCVQNEINILRCINHEGVLKLEDVFETQNSVYLCTEYLKGKSLNDLLKDYQPTLEQTRTIVIKILQAVAYLHKLRIIHRDIKPCNIVFRDFELTKPVLIDFGLATHQDQPSYIYTNCGTPGFTAPEILSSKMTTGQDPVCDIFSVGAVIHYILFKRVPFQGTSMDELSLNNLKGSIKYAQNMQQRTDSDLCDLMKKMLQKNPQKRVTAQQALSHSFFRTRLSKKQDVQINITFNKAQPSYQPKPDLNFLAPDRLKLFFDKGDIHTIPACVQTTKQLTPSTDGEDNPGKSDKFTRAADEKAQWFSCFQPSRKKVHYDSGGEQWPSC